MAGHQVVVDIYGPEPRDAQATADSPGGTYTWPGAALSTSTRRFYFDRGLRTLVRATWELAWIPDGTGDGVRLVHMDDGPTNITQIAERTGAPAGYEYYTADLTSAINALIASGVFKHIGLQWKASGTIEVHRSSLVLVFGD